MNNPLVSVIIPTLNSQEYIKKSIQSLLNQTLENIEIIIIDDNSQDDTRKIINSFNDDRIKLIHRKNAGNLPSARNKGIKEANGKYIANQDSDDYSLPSRLQTQIKQLKKHNVDIIGVDAFNINKQGNIITNNVVPEKVTKESFHNQTPFIHGSILFDSKIFDDLELYNEEYEVAEDVELLYRAISQGYEMKNVKQPLYAFRIDEDSTYRSNIRKTKLYSYYAKNKSNIPIELSDFVSLLDDELLKFIPKNHRKQLYNELAQEYIRLNQIEKGRKYALQNKTVYSLLIFILSLFPKNQREKMIKTYRKYYYNNFK